MNRTQFIWDKDATTPPRWRCFVGPFELYVYEDGTWGVFDNRCLAEWMGQPRARGQAPSLASGQQRALAAYKLVKKLRSIENG